VPVQTALDKALKLLAARARTTLELDRALERAGFPAPERESALARVRELGYINDPETARSRARSRIGQGDAPRLAARRLLAQGIDEPEAKAAAAEAAAGVGDEELAAQALKRRLRGRQPATEKEKQRLLRALISKGHRPSAAAKALGIEWDGNDETDDS
jgi:SOS response regulatory protein OraA/RecX